MTPAQFWAIEMQNQQNQQAQQQQNQQNIMSGIMGIADAYTENQQMKSDGKIYGDLLKFAAPLIGDTKGELLKRYNESEDREKVSMGRALFGGGMFATMSQAHNFGNRLGVQQDQQALTARQQQITAAAPATRAVATAAGRVASGQGTINRSAIGYNRDAIGRPNPTTGP
jgi:hypothetical protein